MTEKLSDEQIKVLEELADNLMTMDRVRRKFAAALLWLSGIIVAGTFVWDKVLSLWGNHK